MEIADRLLEFTRHGPTVLIFEDLHRADKSSLAGVEFFASELKDRPLSILATSRPAASLSSVGRRQLEAFESATKAGRIELQPLSSEETAVYLKSNDPTRDFSPEENRAAARRDGRESVPPPAARPPGIRRRGGGGRPRNRRRPLGRSGTPHA